MLTLTPDQKRKTAKVEADLKAAGIAVEIWRMSRIFGTRTLQYRFETMNGILDIGTTSVHLIAVCNDKPNNGAFAMFMSALEKVAKDNALDVSIHEIWNERLAKNLKEKRGYFVTGNEAILIQS